jgi:GH24 family phage-related lysozyme (muramidase)
VLTDNGFRWRGSGAPDAFIWAPDRTDAPRWGPAYSMVQEWAECDGATKTSLGGHHLHADCAVACQLHGFGCTFFEHGPARATGTGSECHMYTLTSLSECTIRDRTDCRHDASECPSIFQLTGSFVPAREDLRTAGIRAFQQLYNYHNPPPSGGDPIPETGQLDFVTSNSMRLSPVDGWAAPNRRRDTSWTPAECVDKDESIRGSSADTTGCDASHMIHLSEGMKRCAYLDTKNIPTIGYGFNLQRADADTQLKALGTSLATVNCFPTLGGLSSCCGSAHDAPATCSASDLSDFYTAREDDCNSDETKCNGVCITEDQALALAKVTYAEMALHARELYEEQGGDFDSLCCSVQNVLIDMTFNLGPYGVRKFPSMLKGVARGDWWTASMNVKHSNPKPSNLGKTSGYYEDVKCRAERNFRTLRAGCKASDGFISAPTGSADASFQDPKQTQRVVEGEWTRFFGNGGGAVSPGEAQDFVSSTMRAFTASTHHEVEKHLNRAVLGFQKALAPGGGLCDARAFIGASSPSGAAPFKAGSVSESDYLKTVESVYYAILQLGGDLATLCCNVQKVMLDLAYGMGVATLKKYTHLLFAVSSSDWVTAAKQIANGATGIQYPRGFCQRSAAQGRCADHGTMLMAGCPSSGFWALMEGFKPAPGYSKSSKDLGSEQRAILPVDPSTHAGGANARHPFTRWKKKGDSGWVDSKDVECVDSEPWDTFGTNLVYNDWWAVPGKVNDGAKPRSQEQPGTQFFGQFVSKHFGHLLERPYTVGSAHLCRKNSAAHSVWSVHSEGRAIDFMIPTWPCGRRIVKGSLGHPTCRMHGDTGIPQGRARNDLGDRLMMWMVTHAEDIGLEFLIWDRTKWSRSNGETIGCSAAQLLDCLAASLFASRCFLACVPYSRCRRGCLFSQVASNRTPASTRTTITFTLS